MKNVLYIKSSVLGENSQTGAMVDALVARWSAEHPQASHVMRDLGKEPLPHLRGEHLADSPDVAKVAMQQLKDADVIVIGAPMYNFSIPSTLKAWFDHVLKSGQTFEYTAEGPRGLLKNKSAVVLVSSGGVYSEGPYAPADFVVPLVTTLLGFMGITDVKVIRAEGAALGEVGVQSKAKALAELALV